MSSYSMDLKERIVAACTLGESQVSVAKRFGVCVRTVSRYRVRAEQGELARRPQPGMARRLQGSDELAFGSMLGEKSDWTLESLGHEWERRSGVLLPRSTLHDYVKRAGGRYKKRVASPKNAAS